MIFDLVKDFADVLDAMPQAHRRYRNLKLLDEAICRDVHFIDRHPTTFFQCMWNSCWWYDCPEAAKHYKEPEDGWTQLPPWKRKGKLSDLLQQWNKQRHQRIPAVSSLRSLRPPPVHLGTAQQAVLMGHESVVTSVAFSPDGQWIATGSWDHTVRVWNAESGEEQSRLDGHESFVTGVAFSPDGRHIVSGADDYTVRIWDAMTGMELHRLDGHGHEVTSVAFCPEGRKIASSSFLTVRITDAVTGLDLYQLDGHDRHVEAVAFSPDGRMIVSGSLDSTIRVWDAESGKELRQEKLDCAILSVAFSVDGRTIVSGSDDGTVRLWDGVTGGELRQMEGHADEVRSVSFSPDGRFVVSGSLERTVRVWETATGEELRKLEGHEDSVQCVAFSPGGNWIVSGSWDTTVRMWDWENGEQTRQLDGNQDELWTVSFSPDGERIVSGSYDDRSVGIWGAKTGEQLRRFCLDSPASNVAMSNDQRRIAFSSADMLRILDTETGAQCACHTLQDGPYVLSISFSPDDCRIVCGLNDATVGVWEVQSGEELLQLRGHQRPVENVQFSPDGRQIVSASKDGTVRVWNAHSGKCLKVLEEGGELDTIADGETNVRFRILTRDRETEVIDTQNNEPIAYFPRRFKCFSAHSSICRWAGCVGNHLYLIELFGGANEMGSE